MRSLPSVDRVLADERLGGVPHPLAVAAARVVLERARALADGVKIHGCTVHFVTADVDHGPIIAQAAVPVHEGDSDATLAGRVLEVEHRVLVAAVRWFCEDRLVSAGRGVRVKNAVADMPALMVPVVNEA